MSVIDKIKDISTLGQGRLVAVYGKSGSGKTYFSATFPKPMLYVKIGDDGLNTIKDMKGIKALEIEKLSELDEILDEFDKGFGKEFKSVLVDTFSLIVNEWRNENIISKSKRMTQNDWGMLLETTEKIIRKLHKLSKSRWVIVTGHEVTDNIEGLEGELLPDVRFAVSKGARTYLEGMANYGIHMIKIQKDVELDDGTTKTAVRYAAEIGPNPYYWTKLQIPPSQKTPNRIFNPTFDKLAKILNLSVDTKKVTRKEV